MTTAEIIAIGTELILGETYDTNTRHIAKTLRTLGITLYRTQTIGDNIDRIEKLMRESLKRADVIITTGGLGPTVDDPTRKAAAHAAGVDLEFDEDIWSQIVDHFNKFGRTPGENQKQQAFFPKSSIPIHNPVGTAPGFIIELGKKSIICLPGVPSEMETLVKISVVPYLQKRFEINEVIGIRTLHASGVGEGFLDDRIDDLETLRNPTVGLTAHSGIISIRIGAKAVTQSESWIMISKIESELKKRLGSDLYGQDDDTLEDAALGVVSRNGWTIACIEYQTGSLLHGCLSRAHNSSFLGGITVQEIDGTYEEILLNVQDQFGATCGIGAFCFTSEQKMDVVLCLSHPEGLEERHLSYAGHPDNLSRWAANLALDWLRRLRDTGPSDG